MGAYFYLLIGLVAGVASGFLGIGGGTIIIPALVFFAKFTQHQAQGTTLALMVAPIGLLAAIKYYQSGNVDLKAALPICLGFFIGGLLGALFVMPIPDQVLKKIFAVFLIVIAINMFFSK